jgi:hypothetical protein
MMQAVLCLCNASTRKRAANNGLGVLAGPPLVMENWRSSGGTACCASSRICTSCLAMRPFAEVKKE